MDIAVKKIELIEWLARVKDKKLLQRVETLRKISANEDYEKRMPKTKAELQKKIDRGRMDIVAGRVYTQSDVEAFFKAKAGK